MPDITIPYAPRSAFMPMHNRTQRWGVVVAHRRAGKCLDVATLIPLAGGGFARMGDLSAGDIVLTERGQPTRVVAAHGVKLGLPCYRVVFSDGESIVCDSEHLWLTQTKYDRAARANRYEIGSGKGAKKVSGTVRKRPGTVKSTAEIAATVRCQGENNHSVVTADPAAYARQSCPIPPYVLGAWLGDGTSRSTHVTTMDGEVVEALRDYAAATGQAVSRIPSGNAGKAETYSTVGDRNTGMFAQLHRRGLIQNKHIPFNYLYSDYPDRVELLRGLMDTDGTIDRRGIQCEFSTKLDVLARDVCVLLSGLGMMPRRGEKWIKGQRYWRIVFRPILNPFRIMRKAMRYKLAPEGKASGHRYIVAVEPVPSRPVRCIEVENPTHLFLCGEGYIPTHNTVAFINELIKGALTCRQKEPRFAYVAPYFAQAKDIAWSYLKYYTAPVPGVQANESELRVDFPNGGRVRLYGADNWDRMRGIYLDGVCQDEIGDQDPRAWQEAIRPALADRRGWGLFGGTPKGMNHFAERWEQALADPDWFTLSLRASDTGLLSSDELADARKAMSEEQYLAEFECSFAASVVGSYWGREMQAAADEGRIGIVRHQPEASVDTWWDLGYNDTTAIWFTQSVGREVHVIDCYENKGEGLPHYARILQHKPYVYGSHNAPHDIRHHEYGSGKSRVETAAALGIRFQVVPNIDRLDGIDAGRSFIARCWFDRDATEVGRRALTSYRKVWDEKRRTFLSTPYHGWESNYADAFRYLAVGHKTTVAARARTEETRRPMQIGGGESAGWMGS